MIRPAEPRDLPAVLALLSEVELPVEGVAEHFASFFVVEDGARIVASVGLELHGEAALVRSLAVVPDLRGTGLGAAVLRRALEEARAQARDRAGGVYALTTTAETYLSRFRFQRLPRAALAPRLFESCELQGACPSSAIAMQWVPASS